MEALLEKEGDVESWNDERMDELSGRVNDGFKEMREGFARVDREMKEGFARVDRKFEQFATREEMNQRFDSMEGRIDRIGNRLDYMLGAMFLAGLGFIADLLIGKI
jgi:hypothetical protein